LPQRRVPDGVAANLAVLDVMGFFEDAKTAKTVRSETITVDGRSFDCWVITSSVKIPAGAAMGGTISDGLMTTWIDKQLLLGVQEVIAYSYKVAPAAGAAPVEYQAKLTQIIRSLKVDQPIPASTFAFIPPADAKEQVAQVAGRTDLTGQTAPSFKGVSLDGKSYSLDSLERENRAAGFLGVVVRTLHQEHADHRQALCGLQSAGVRPYWEWTWMRAAKLLRSF
jgi:hypothetical protein